MDEIKKMTSTEAMQLAIDEAKKGFGFVSPNPPVGCVILDKNFHFLASGYHKKLGEDHAELDALKKVKDPNKLTGAHIFVTLEPCAHEGRTPSCAKTLAQLPIASVTYGLKDPNPLVAGKGLQILLDAGIHVDCIEGFKKQLEDLADVFLFNMREKKCFIALKVASSIDGQIAMANGESQWITNSQARERSHDLRGVYDATAVGYGTFIKDNPSLNIRSGKFKNKDNHKVLLFDKDAKSLNALKDSNLYKNNEKNNIFIVIDSKLKDISTDLGVHLIFVKHHKNGELDVEDFHKNLLEHQIHSLYIEGGSQVLSYFITHRAFNSLYLFLGSKLLGRGLSWTKDLQYPTLSQALSLQLSQCEIIDSDLLLKYHI